MLVTSGEQTVRYLFEKKPTVKFESVEGVMNANLYIQGEVSPVVSVPMKDGMTMKVSYDSWVVLALNNAGFATFSAAEVSYIATNGVKAYKAVVNGETITLTALNGNIPAATGVMLYGKDMAGKTVELPVAEGNVATNVADNSLLPTTKADGTLAEKPSNSWALGNENMFLRYTGNAFIHNRAYLVHEATVSGAKAMRMIFSDEEATGIDNAVIEKSARDGKFRTKDGIVIIKNGVKYNVAGQVIK